MPPKTGHKLGGKHRKMLIYGAVAAAMLLVLLLARRSSSSSSTGTSSGTDTSNALPASSPGVDPSGYYTDSGSGASGVDYGPQLASIDTDVQTLGQAVAALQSSAQTPGANTPGTAGTFDPTADIVSVLQALQPVPASGPSTTAYKPTAPKQPGPGNRAPKKPAAKPKPKPQPRPSGGAPLTRGKPRAQPKSHHPVKRK